METTDARPVIELKGRSSISEMEELLFQIVSAPADTDILLANSLKERSFAATAAYMQLVVTWARNCPHGRVRFHVSEGAGREGAAVTLGRALKTDHALLATMLAADVRARRGVQDLTPLADEIVRERYAKMDRVDEIMRKGQHTFAICVDESDYEATPLFYQARSKEIEREPELFGSQRFGNIARRVEKRVNEGIGKRGAFAGQGGLSTALYELFKNTHEWARTDGRGNPYPAGISARGIRVERHNLDVSLERKMIEDQPALRDFFTHPSLVPLDGRRRFVEMTVFDSGPGVAAHRLVEKHGRDAEPDVGDEHTALWECLRKHISSSKEESKGIGLHRVLTDLTGLSAFLWLRAGRLSLYRDFVRMPYDPESSDDEPYLLDWNAGLGGITEMAPVAGSFFTALLPIGHDPNQTSL